VDGLVGTAEEGEVAVELGRSVAEPGYSAVADQRTCASNDGEPVPSPTCK
jgi:hypothetical protein